MQLSSLITLLQEKENQILADWIQEQMAASSLRLDLMSEKELKQQSREFLKLLIELIQREGLAKSKDQDLSRIQEFLAGLSDTRANQGFTSIETATFVFSLKQPILNQLSQIKDLSSNDLNEEVWSLTTLLDKLGLYTVETFQKTREKIIARQQQEMLELSTPVVKLWDGILMLPLIGTLDSARTQQVMESLLQKLIDTDSSVAIIDITGIPMVDTLVAQHLIKTMSAARLMGADCVLSGIRPQIAQTIVHLGISLQDVVTKATLADAVRYAMQKANFTVVRKTS